MADNFPPRPTDRSEEYFIKYAQEIVVDVMKSFGADWDDSKKGKAVDILAGVLPLSNDGFERAFLLRVNHGWDIVNERTVHILREGSQSSRNALADIEAAWVMKTGVRFPAKEGDRVLFRMEATAPQMTGSVEGVMPLTATGVIVWSPTSGPPITYRVPAEKISGVYDKTTDNYKIVPKSLYANRVEEGLINLTEEDTMVAVEKRARTKESK